MADLDRDLPFRPAVQEPQAAGHLTLLGLVREVLDKPHMLAGAMALTLLFACLLGALLAFVTGQLWGFLLFFPAAITLVVWAAMRARRANRQVSGDAGAARRPTKTE
ncbi:hypothetical protein [Micromonospora cathayae]|uniref:Uncharacterized protein n=1 Tax=Micromonospora cathayae TaxID=3028804 RepID=A0ABY7ZLJ7_9ACTN|nr:hypothetical protein [Micromonospora sp. HUAS 3]WDZ83762.1 hypothetical protein PVK37_25360 [Micromonospora sp. HUAS 3]